MGESEATAEQPQAAVSTAENKAAAGAAQGFRLGLWEGLALVVGLAGDIAKPLGNYSLWLMIAGIAAFVLLFVLRRVAFARTAMLHAGFFTLIMATIWGLQQFATPEDKGDERGATVAFLPFLAPIQTKLLPLPENQKLLMQFQDSIATGSDAERVATARELYAGTDDPALQRGMIETMMTTGNAALQQAAILMRLAERRGDRLALPPVNRDATDALSRRLLSYNFRVNNVDVDRAALDLFGDGHDSDGTVGRQGVTMQLYIDLADGQRELMIVDLKPGPDLMLTGTARLETGAKVAVEMPLF